MKITTITVYHVDLPLEHPYWLSGGRLKFECLDAHLLSLKPMQGSPAGAKAPLGDILTYPPMGRA